jgi:hypothetical protein
VSVASSDIVAYLSANMPDSDSGTAGGAIDALRRPDFTQIAANDTIEAVSSSAGDTTQTVTVEARAASGSVVSETKTLTGTTPISFSTLGTVERILKVELSATCAGSVTVRRTTGPTTIRVIPAGERGFWMIFRKDASDPSSQVDYYAKIFLKNTHGTLSALSATVKQNADPSGLVTHALAASVGDSGTVTNRITSPGFTFDDTDKVVPGTDLAAGAAIGVWLRLRLAAGQAAAKTTYTTELAFQTV